MPIEKIDLEKDYESGIVNALIKNSEKINELIDFINTREQDRSEQMARIINRITAIENNHEGFKESTIHQVNCLLKNIKELENSKQPKEESKPNYKFEIPINKRSQCEFCKNHNPDERKFCCAESMKKHGFQKVEQKKEVTPEMIEIWNSGGPKVFVNKPETQPKEEEPLKCPWCGTIPEASVLVCLPPIYQIKCSFYGCQNKSGFHGSTQQEAIAAWNLRK